MQQLLTLKLKIMKKLFLILTLVLGLATTSSCGGDKANTEKTQEEVAEAAKDTDFDIDRLKEMTDANKKEFTKDDVEFLLDQAEILADQTRGMTKEQKQEYLSKLDKDKAGAVMVIAFALASAQKTGAMTPDQIERYQEMQKE